MEENALPKTYDFKSTEERIYTMWEEKGYFSPWNAPNKEGFDPNIKPFVISIPPPNVTGELHLGHALFVSMEDLLARSDIVSLHLPGIPETYCLVNDEFLTRMKSGAVLVNTARGELLDEEAVVRALESRKLRGVALDVFENEPPGADNPILAFEQVIATPHMGAHSDSSTNAMGWRATLDCLAVLQGEEPLYRIV